MYLVWPIPQSEKGKKKTCTVKFQILNIKSFICALPLSIYKDTSTLGNQL